MTGFVKRSVSLAAIATTAMMLLASAGARAAAPPVKLELTGHITGGFSFPEGVAVAPDGNIYVTDRGHNRVQELTPTGEFVLMFGMEVNETKDKTLGASEAEKNVCTEEEVKASGVKCKAGVQGSGAGAFAEAQSVAIAPDGNVYVQDVSNWRVDEYSDGGQFVLMIGKEVNETNKDNLCTEEEVTTSGVKCKAGIQNGIGSHEHGAFHFSQFTGDALVVGPAPERLLYVGDQGRVQEFNAAGAWIREIAVGCEFVGAVAVDEAGDMYTACGQGSVIQEFSPDGVELEQFAINPRFPGSEMTGVDGLALDSEDRLAVEARELELELPRSGKDFGSLYNASTGHLMTEFALPEGSSSMTFGAGPEALLYAVVDGENGEVAVYTPVRVAELLTSPVVCAPGAESETDVTLDCSLNGMVNPEGVAETEVLFEWGATPSLGELTPKQLVEESKAVSVPIEGVRPNETFYDRLSGNDQNAQPPERLTSETATFTTPSVAPRIVGAASVQFVTASSAVMLGELNPENTNTTYQFQYGACADLESCPGTLSTSALESAAYGKVGTTQEASGLQPDTTYRYRLLANDEHTLEGKLVGGQATGPEGTFTTGPAPVPQAATGAASALGASTATISGTVDPDGQPATYSFELGVYAGAGTQYGIVFSGSAGASVLASEESLALTGLQPGTVYAYRIVLKSGYGTATGQAVLFTTLGLPAVIEAPASLGMLAVPSIVFPAAVTPKTKAGSRQKGKAKRRRKRAKRPQKAHKSERGPHGKPQRGRETHAK